MARQPRGLRARRKQKRQNMFVPRPQQRVLAPSYLRVDEGELRPALVIEVSRPAGVMGGTLRFTDKEFKGLPDGGMHWVAARDMYPDPAYEGSARGGGSTSTTPQPSGGARLMDRADPEEDFIPEPTPRRRRRRKTSSATTRARQRSMKAAAAAENSAEVQGEKTSLQPEREAGKLPAGRKGASKSTNQPTSRRTKMSPAARRRGRAATAEVEPEAKTTTRKGRGRKAAAAEPEAAAKTNGNRRTHEDIVALVPEIVKHLKAGVTMTEIRLGGDTVGEKGYGAGPVIRKALAEAGYNTKGEKVEVEDLTELEGKKLAAAVAELREDGKAWYYLELATDMSQSDLKELLEENGFGELASGRVTLGEEEEEEPAPKPAARKRTGRAAKAAEAEPEADAPKTTRRRGRRQAANPS